MSWQADYLIEIEESYRQCDSDRDRELNPWEDDLYFLNEMDYDDE